MNLMLWADKSMKLKIMHVIFKKKINTNAHIVLHKVSLVQRRLCISIQRETLEENHWNFNCLAVQRRTVRKTQTSVHVMIR